MVEPHGGSSDDSPKLATPKFQSTESGLRRFLAELSKRKVYHTSVIYVAAAWAIIQFADIAGPRLGIPEGAITILLLILIIGFPVVIILSWAFEIKAHGWPAMPSAIISALVSIRYVVLWIVALSLGVVLTTIMIGGLPKTSFALSPKESVIVGDFQNFTSDPLLDDSLTLAFRVGLEQSRHAFVMPHAWIQEALSQMLMKPNAVIDRNLGIQVSQRLGARALIIGSIGEVGGRYKITSEVLDPRNGRTVLLESATVQNRDGVLEAIDRQTRKLRIQLGESIKGVSQSTVQLEQVTTSNLDALKAYSLGIAAAGAGKVEDAIVLLERAIALDPTFSMAHAKIAILYHFALDNTKSATRHRDLALRYSDRLTERERVYVEGYATESKKPADMVRAWRLMRSLYPKESVGHHNLGTTLWRYENDLPAALKFLEQASGIANPWQHASFHNLGYVKMGLGDFDGAIESFEKAWRTASYPSDGGLALAYIAGGQYELAREFLEQARQATGEQVKFDIEDKWIAYYLDQGLFGQGALHVALALERARDIKRAALEHRVLGSRIAMMERYGESSMFNEALEEQVAAELPLLGMDIMELGFAPVEHVLFLGKVSARNGRLDLAHEIMQRVLERAEIGGFYFREAYSNILAGELALADGKAGDAIQQFELAASEQPLFQAHESLARAQRQFNNIEAAITEYEWLVEHRGLVFSEKMSSFYGRDFAILDWAVAHYHLGLLYEQTEDLILARKYFEAFLEQWADSDEAHPLISDARMRLSSFGPEVPLR